MGNFRWNWVKAAGAAGMVAGVMIGCQATPRQPYGAGADPISAKSYPKVAVVDDDNLLQGAVVVDYDSAVTTGPADGTPMSVMVPIRSVVANRMRLQYQYYWRDANGVELRQSGWKRVEVEAGMQVQAKGSAVTLDAVDWRLEVRPAR